MKKLLSLFLTFILILFCAAAEAENGMSLLAINVGKADCLLLRSGESCYLIDSGRASDWGAISCTLRLNGITHLNGVILTHTDEDHAGGLTALAESDLTIDTWYAPKYFTGVKKKKHPAVLAAALRGQEVTWLVSGDTLPLDGGVITVLGPVEENNDRENNNSLVLRAETSDGSILLCGDMELDEESQLLSLGLIAPVTVLKVPDHAEEHATSSALVKACSPQIAVISTDSGEEKDTPAVRVLQALKDAGATTAITQYAEEGVLVTLSEGNAICQLKSHDPLPDAVEGVIISDLSVAQDIICIENTGDSAADLSGWFLYSDRGDEIFIFPDGTELAPGASVSVSALDSEDAGNFIWQDNNVWHSSGEDTACLYDAYGRLMDQY